jgi:hypothetical protein
MDLARNLVDNQVNALETRMVALVIAVEQNLQNLGTYFGAIQEIGARLAVLEHKVQVMEEHAQSAMQGQPSRDALPSGPPSERSPTTLHLRGQTVAASSVAPSSVVQSAPSDSSWR